MAKKQESGEYIDQEELNKRLDNASGVGRNEDIKELVRRGADVNCDVRGAYTVLGVAAARGHESTVQMLIQLGANVDKKGSGSGWSPLHLSCMKGHTACCDVLIKAGCNIEATDEGGKSPLHWSCMNGHTACCELLIESGCNIEATDSLDRNAMHHACDEGHLNIIQLLLSSGLSLDAPTDMIGRTGRMILREKDRYRDDVNQRKQECLKALEDDSVQLSSASTTAADTPETVNSESESATVLTDDVNKAKKLIKCIASVLRKDYANVKEAIDSSKDNIQRLADQLYSDGIITTATLRNPSFQEIHQSFIESLIFFKSEEDISQICEKYFAAFLKLDGLFPGIVKKQIEEIIKESNVDQFVINLMSGSQYTAETDSEDLVSQLQNHEEDKGMLQQFADLQDKQRRLQANAPDEMTELLRIQIEEEGKVHLSNVKGILIGPPATGKTVTINRLTGKMVNISTDGGKASTGIEKPIMLHLYHDSKMESFFIDEFWSPQTLDEQLGTILHCMSKSVQTHGHYCPSSTTEDDTKFSPMSRQESDTQHHKDSFSTAKITNTPSSKVIGESEELDAYFSMLQEFIEESKWDEVQRHLGMAKDVTLFHIIDTGGQPEYFQIFPLLLQGPCFCLIFLNLAHSLDKLFQITYRDTPTSHSCIQYQSSYTQLQMIEMILASIHSLNSASNVSKAFLIGTYLDQATKNFDIDRMMKKIEDSLKGTSFYQDDFLATYTHTAAGGKLLYRFLYALDNLHGTENEISELRQILTGIIKVVFPSEPLPTSWGVFHLLLRHKYEGEGLCTLDQCVVVGKACGLKTEKNVKLTLKYLHTHFGTILYFEKVKSLKSTVICDPNLVFRPITNLIAGSFGANPSLPQIAERIRNTGEIPLQVLENACKHKSGTNGIPTKAIIDLLVYHNILTDEIRNSKGKKIRFMSCLLKPCLPTSTSQLIADHERSILFTFHPHKYQPVSLFHVLVSKLLMHPGVLLSNTRYSNKISFLYDSAEVELESTLKYIKLVVANCSPEEQQLMHNLVQKELNSVVNEVPHMNGTEIEVSFFCPNAIHNQQDPLHTVDLTLSTNKENVIMQCMECESFGQRTMTLNDYHKAWFHTDMTDCKPFSNIKSTDVKKQAAVEEENGKLLKELNSVRQMNKGLHMEIENLSNGIKKNGSNSECDDPTNCKQNSEEESHQPVAIDLQQNKHNDNDKDEKRNKAKNILRTNQKQLVDIIVLSGLENVIRQCEAKYVITEAMKNKLIEETNGKTSDEKASRLLDVIRRSLIFDPSVVLDKFLCILFSHGGVNGQGIARQIAGDYKYPLRDFNVLDAATLTELHHHHAFKESNPKEDNQPMNKSMEHESTDLPRPVSEKKQSKQQQVSDPQLVKPFSVSTRSTSSFTLFLVFVVSLLVALLITNWETLCKYVLLKR